MKNVVKTPINAQYQGLTEPLGTAYGTQGFREHALRNATLISCRSQTLKISFVHESKYFSSTGITMEVKRTVKSDDQAELQSWQSTLEREEVIAARSTRSRLHEGREHSVFLFCFFFYLQ